MDNIVNIIKSFTSEDYACGRVNLHIHSLFSDGKADVENLILQAKEKKYKYISITDHNTVQAHLNFKDEILISGVEFDVWYKYIFFHLLAYGINVKDETLQKFYAKSKQETQSDIVRIFAKRDVAELITSIHHAGGIAVLAHPACCWALNMEQFVKDLASLGLDGIEVYYPYPRWRKYFRFASQKKIIELADKYNLIKTGGTDLHDFELN